MGAGREFEGAPPGIHGKGAPVQKKRVVSVAKLCGMFQGGV